MVPPVLSRVIPMIAPRIIRNPIDAIVFPNPSLIVLTIRFGGSVVNARNRETRNRAMKAFSFNLEVSTTIAIMLISTRRDFNKTAMFQDYVKKRYATKIAVVKPTRSASNPHPIEYLVFLIPTEPKYTAII